MTEEHIDEVMAMLEMINIFPLHIHGLSTGAVELSEVSLRMQFLDGHHDRLREDKAGDFTNGSEVDKASTLVDFSRFNRDDFFSVSVDHLQCLCYYGLYSFNESICEP